MTRFEWARGTARLVLAGNLGLRFLVELAVFASLGYAGASASGSDVVRVVWASVLPLGAIALWSRFLSPKATRRLREPNATLLEVSIFLGTAIALARSASVAFGATLGGVAVANALLVRVLEPSRRGPGSPMVGQLVRR